jgi:alpha-1,6-mannosyltransferase
MFPQVDASKISIDQGLWRFLSERIWKHFVFWPEGMVFLFNAIENKSSEYGTSPWYWYFISALPKGLLGTGLLIPLAFWKDRMINTPRKSIFHNMDMAIMPFLFPSLLFVGLYSILPHKEMRFIFVILPMLNVTAAKGLTYLHTYIVESLKSAYKKKEDEDDHAGLKSTWLLVQRLSMTRNRIISVRSSFILLICILFAIASLLSSFAGSLIFVAISRHNYPGGNALELLTKNLESSSLLISSMTDERLNKNPCIMNRSLNDGLGTKANKYIEIYVDVAASMTGVSLFGQRSVKRSNKSSVSCSFVKAGYETEHEQSLHQQHLKNFMYIVTEQANVPGFRTVGKAQGFPRLRYFRISTDDAIYVMRNENCL